MIWYLDKNGFTTRIPCLTARKEPWHLNETNDRSRPRMKPLSLPAMNSRWRNSEWKFVNRTNPLRETFRIDYLRSKESAECWGKRKCIAMPSFLMKPALRVVWMTLKNHFDAWSCKLSKILLKSFLPNCLRHYLPHVLWITTVICCQGQRHCLEPSTQSSHLRPIRLRNLCTNLSPMFTRPNSSPWAALVLFAPKKERKLWFLVDFRILNKNKTIRNRLSIPHTDVLIDKCWQPWETISSVQG